MSNELGYWTGSITYTASYAPAPYIVNFGAMDSNGTDWLWMQVQGWDSPGVVGEVVQRASDHGGYPTQQYFTPRAVTLTVRASAVNQAQRDVARAALQQALPVNDLAVLVYNEPIPKQMKVRRAGQVVETYYTLNEVEFACVLVAPDPRKYAVTQKQFNTNMLSTIFGVTVPFVMPVTFPAMTPAGSVSVTNIGNFETRPTIAIQGPVTSPTVTLDNGRFIAFTQLAVHTGDTLVINTDTKIGTLNGALRNADINSWWWVLQPGIHTITLGGISPTGGASMTVSYQDAWI